MDVFSYFFYGDYLFVRDYSFYQNFGFLGFGMFGEFRFYIFFMQQGFGEWIFGFEISREFKLDRQSEIMIQVGRQ